MWSRQDSSSIRAIVQFTFLNLLEYLEKKENGLEFDNNNLISFSKIMDYIKEETLIWISTRQNSKV